MTVRETTRVTGRNRRRGFTLLELLVVLAVLGTLAGVVAAAAPRPVASAPADAWTDGVARARARALASGRPVHVVLRGAGDTAGAPGTDVLALPDGRVLAAGVDGLTGRAVPTPSRNRVP